MSWICFEIFFTTPCCEKSYVQERSEYLFGVSIKNSMIFWRLKTTIDSFFHVSASFIEIDGIP